MTINETLIYDYIDRAAVVLEECCDYFERPTIEEVNIGKGTSYWATVKKLKNSNFSIRVSKMFNSVDEDKFNDRLMSTMIHELIHTIPGCMNHQAPFKKVAAMVNRVYPQYKVQRCARSSEYGVPVEVKEYKYLVTCHKCGAEWKYKRAPNVWKQINKKHSSFTCPYCGGDHFTGELL